MAGRFRLRRNKHGAVGVREDGIFFPSKGEHRRYQELKTLALAGRVHRLEVHPRFPIVYQGKVICNVVLDFKYYTDGDGWVYEDFKGWQTSESKLRHKLFEVFFGQKILITRAGGR
jgi:hypothetical protein